MTPIRILFDAEAPDVVMADLSALLAAGVDADAVSWCGRGDDQASLFDAGAAAGEPPPAERRPLAALSRLPDGFLPLARQVAMHAEPERFLRLHRFARALSIEPRRWQDTLDPDRIALERMAREVRREIHKMHAFVRFRVLPESQPERRVAWFEPQHAIVRAAAPFFVKRFAAMHWSILTPRLTVHWDRTRLRFGPGADPSQAPAPDAGEAIWLAYYRSIFNPMRLNPLAMTREMPRRYWSNLPEATLIPEMIRDAPVRRLARQMASPTPTTFPVGSLDAATRPTPRTPGRPPASCAASRAVDDLAVPAAERRLADLARRARYCSDCPLAASATQTVWGEGTANARVMIVGEQPGDHEDLAGRPFVGPAGRLLRDAIVRLAWPTEALYLTNAVKHFRFEPRGKRRIHKTPGQREMLACGQWLAAEIAAVRPRALLALGSTAASSLLGRQFRVGDAVGRWQVRADGLPVWVVHHPAAVLRRAESGAPAFADWVDTMRPAWDPPAHAVVADEPLPGVGAVLVEQSQEVLPLR